VEIGPECLFGLGITQIHDPFRIANRCRSARRVGETGGTAARKTISGAIIGPDGTDLLCP
jgi:hypothetical protein